jgi:glutathione reductase (NADPH)
MSDQYDLIVIGGGSGGLACAQRAAEHGARAVVIESHRLGGTCVNAGCVPKKIMWNAASIAGALEDAASYGFSIVGPGRDTGIAHDWAALRKARDAYVLKLNGIYEHNLIKRKVELRRGRARLLSPGSVAVLNASGEAVLRGARVVLATGGRPIMPNIPGCELGINSDGFFELDRLPRRVAVVGSGYVAAELSGVLAALGAQVTLILRADRVLRDFDVMLGHALVEEMTAQGIQVLKGTTLVRAQRGEGIELTTQQGQCLRGFDAVLWAVGRQPNTDDLGLEKAGVATDAEGFIITDAYQDTNVAGVHAIGDVTGREALTPVAIAAGRRLSDRLFGGQEGRHLSYEMIPTVIFSHPPIGTVGVTEAAARERHGDAVRVYTTDFLPLYHGLTPHKPRSRMKLVTLEPQQRIVGCHVIGRGADEMLQGFAVAIRMGATKRDFDDTVAIHPTNAEEMVTMR